MQHDLLNGPLHNNELAQQRSLCVWRYFDIRLVHTLVCIEGRYLNADQRVKVVFSSLKNVPHVGFHTMCLRVLCMHKKFDVRQ